MVLFLYLCQNTCGIQSEFILVFLIFAKEKSSYPLFQVQLSVNTGKNMYVFYAASMETIQTAMARLKEYLKENGTN